MIVELRDGLDHLLAIGLRLGEQIVGNLHVIVLGSQRLIAPDPGLHRNEIDDAFELVFGSYRDLNRYGPGA